jgi:hypothetical protein
MITGLGAFLLQQGYLFQQAFPMTERMETRRNEPASGKALNHLVTDVEGPP